MDTVYVVVEEYNQYDQMGAYFKGVYATYEDAQSSIDHVGRIDSENSWNQIVCIPFGTSLPYDRFGCIDSTMFYMKG